MKYAAEAWTMTRGISEQLHTIVDDNVDFDIDILKPIATSCSSASYAEILVGNFVFVNVHYLNILIRDNLYSDSYIGLLHKQEKKKTILEHTYLNKLTKRNHFKFFPHWVL